LKNFAPSAPPLLSRFAGVEALRHKFKQAVGGMAAGVAAAG